MSEDDGRDLPMDHTSPDVVAARANVAKAIADFLRIARPEEDPYVVAWVVGVGWTNSELERTGYAGRDTIAPDDQTVSASAGLGAFITARFAT